MANRPIESLIDNYNGFVYKDSYDFTWIASLNGMNRFDGQKVKKYLPDKNDPTQLQEGLIQSNFFEDVNGDLWFSTVNYIHRYNRKTDDFSHFRHPADSTTWYRGIDLINDTTFLMQIGSTILAFNTRNHTWEKICTGFQGIDYATVTNENGQLSKVYSSRNFYGHGVLCVSINADDNTTIDTLIIEDDFNTITRGNKATWVGGVKNLYRVDHNNVITRYKNPIQARIDHIDFLRDRNKLLVVCGGDIWLFSLATSSYKNLTDRDDTHYSMVHYISTKEIYGWSNEKGLTLMDFFIQTPWHLEESTVGPVVHIDEISLNNHDYLFYSTEGGNTFVKNTTTCTKILERMNSATSSIGLDESGNLLAGNDDGVYVFNSSEWTKSISYSASNYTCGTKTKDQIKIFCKAGVISLDNTGSPIDTSYAEEQISQIYRVRDRLFGIGNSGIFEFFIHENQLEEKNKYYHNAAINHFQLVDDTLLYVASSEGIKIFNTQLTHEVGHILMDNYIESIYVAGDKTIWAGTRSGILRRSPGGLVNIFNKQNGLPIEIFTRGCMDVAKDGTLFIGGNGGILSFHPDSVVIEPYDPGLVLTSFKIHGHEWGDDSVNIELLDALEVDHDESTITFEFCALDYSIHGKPQYRVYLEGYDTDTTLIGDQRSITYPNLKHGNYHFHYSACSSNGSCKPEFSTFNLVVAPPFWLTWWFLLALGLVIVSAIAGAIRLYIYNRLREQRFIYEKQELQLKTELQLQQERNRIADELHDELGGKLSSIKFAGKKVQRAKELSEVKAINQRVSAISTELIESMRSIIWAMDTHNDSLSSLLANIRQYASTLGEDNDLSIKLDFPPLDEKRVVKGQIRHHLYLAVKEVLNNILKHSEATVVGIEATLKEDVMHLKIHENGKGFDPDAITSTGRGLKTIRKRIENINGKLIYTRKDGMLTEMYVPLTS